MSSLNISGWFLLYGKFPYSVCMYVCMYINICQYKCEKYPVAIYIPHSAVWLYENSNSTKISHLILLMHFCHIKTLCPLHDLALFFKPICYSHTHLVKLKYVISQSKIFICLFLLVTVPSVNDNCSNETCLHHC